MATVSARDSLGLQLIKSGDGQRSSVVVEIIVNDRVPTPQFRGLALASEMFGPSPGPLEGNDVVALVGRCTECLDLLCGYTDTYVTRQADEVSWQMREIWYEPQAEVESAHLNWQMKFSGRVTFDATAYDAEITRARTQYEALLRDA